MERDRLLSYPYVIVRLKCAACHREGSYRLARLAEKYGAGIEMDGLLLHLVGACKKFCKAHLLAPRRR